MIFPYGRLILPNYTEKELKKVYMYNTEVFLDTYIQHQATMTWVTSRKPTNNPFIYFCSSLLLMMESTRADVYTSLLL